MWTLLISWFAKSNVAKAGAGAVGVGGLLSLILSLHTDVKKEIAEQKKAQREYVDLVLAPLKTEIRHNTNESKEIKVLVRDIHRHLLRSNNQ